MAAFRKLEVTLISAKDLNDVNIFSKMDVYAVVCIADEPHSIQRIPTDKDGGKNPKWNTTLIFYVPVDPAAVARLVLHVLLRSQRTLGDRDIGDVHIPLKELLIDGDGKAPPSASQFVSYQVCRRSSGKPKGVLNLSYKFIEPATAVDHALMPPLPVAYPTSGPGTDLMPADPVTVYPPPRSSATPTYPPPGMDFKTSESAITYLAPDPSGAYPPPGVYPPYGYAPPPPGYGYPQLQYGYAPPPPGYGYPPPPAGYGYGAAPQAPPKKNNFGVGLGAGLLGGALGGLLIGDLVSDAAAYDAGYDAGFDDGFGF